MRLPSAYQEVEYIESSGTQWIDTGVIPTGNIKSQIKLRTLANNQSVIYGAEPSNSDGGYNYQYRFFINANQFYFHFTDTSPNDIHGGTFNINEDYELEIGNRYIKNINTSSTIASGTAKTFTGTITIKLNRDDRENRNSSNRWYYVKIRDGSTIIRDFVPCYRKSDDVIGMYDTVNNTFYTNSGTGTFTKGPNVEYPPEYKLHGAIQTFHWKAPEVNTYLNENTIAYYPLTEDLLDHKTNGNTLYPLSANGSGYSFSANADGYKAIYFTGNTYLYPGSGNVWGKHIGTDDVTIAFRVCGYTSPSYGTYGVSGYNTGILSFNTTFKSGISSDGVVGRAVGLLDGCFEGFSTTSGYSEDTTTTPTTITTPLVSGVTRPQTYLDSFLSVVWTFHNGHQTTYVSSSGFGVDHPYWEGDYASSKTVSYNYIGRGSYNTSNYRYMHGYMRDFVVAGDVWTKDMIKAYFNEDLGGNSSSGGGGSTSGAAIQ